MKKEQWEKTAEGKAYHREYGKKYWVKNKEKMQKRYRERKREIAKWIDEIKAQKKCSICGFDNPLALDFHHRNKETKKDSIANMKSAGNGRVAILKEIAKCDVICSNCHRIEHGEAKDWNN